MSIHACRSNIYIYIYIYICMLIRAYLFGYVGIRSVHVCFGWILYNVNQRRLFNGKSSLYIYIKYLKFGLVAFYGISTIAGYLMPTPLYTYILNIKNCLVAFYGISTIEGNLVPTPLYTYISNIKNFVRLRFMAYQPSQVI